MAAMGDAVNRDKANVADAILSTRFYARPLQEPTPVTLWSVVPFSGMLNAALRQRAEANAGHMDHVGDQLKLLLLAAPQDALNVISLGENAGLRLNAPAGQVLENEGLGITSSKVTPDSGTQTFHTFTQEELKFSSWDVSASETPGAIGQTTPEFSYHTMCAKEFAAVQANGGLAIRPGGSSQLGITLNPEYGADLMSRNPKKWAVHVQLQVQPGTFDELISRGAVHDSAANAYPKLPLFKSGMSVPQIKLERGGVLSILLGNSPESVEYFNSKIISIKGK
jgi:hypothetical protein